MQLRIDKSLGNALPITYLTIDDWQEKKKELLKLFDTSELQNDDDVLNTYSDVDTVNNTHITNEYYRLFETELNYVFLRKLKLEVDIDQAWFECAEKNMYHGLHNHGALGFSSCLYIDFDKHEHDPLILIAPYVDAYSGEVIEYVPTGMVEGTLIVFPSCLAHYTEPNKSDKRRLVIAANYAS